MSSLGDAVVAIGVFDGVHIGHRALLETTCEEAIAQGVSAVAVTFDRDPDQVVSPETAAPQLLSLADKLQFIAETGIDTILVIGFDAHIASMVPEVFLQSVLSTALRPVALHVGRDFRFGAAASGDLSLLARYGMSHGFSVTGHELVEVGGQPVTSTRIRGLVASGDVVAAHALLGRPPRVAGAVRRGRGDGAKLGFPTANLTPEPFAALPADGVYAGRAILADAAKWAAAISVGRPPTFPEARDYLEAHVIDFEGDLYDQRVTLEFFERLRSQKTYSSLGELTLAIEEDIDRALEIAGFDDVAEDSESWFGDTADEEPLVMDPVALEAAERAVRGIDPSDVFRAVDDDWVELLGPIVLSGMLGSAGANAFRITAPLEAAGIPFGWQPYSPEEMPAFRPAYGAIDRPFTLFVPASRLVEARSSLNFVDMVDDALHDDEVCRIQDEVARSHVEDPEALEAAELRVRIDASDLYAPIDWDSWVPVLVDQPYDQRRLFGLQFALQAAGIQVKWDPFSPLETSLLKHGFFVRNEFTLAVPSDRLDEAQDLIEHFDAQSE